MVIFIDFATANGIIQWLGSLGFGKKRKSPWVFVPSNIEVFCRCPLKGKSMEIPGPKNGGFIAGKIIYE